MIDTPGLLDRDLSDRNEFELRGILALKHLSDLIVFMFDPSESCGYSMEDQEHLFKAIKKEFSSVPIIEVENKTDMVKTKSDRMKLSAITGDGVPKLVDAIIALLKPQQHL